MVIPEALLLLVGTSGLTKVEAEYVRKQMFEMSIAFKSRMGKKF